MRNRLLQLEQELMWIKQGTENSQPQAPSPKQSGSPLAEAKSNYAEQLAYPPTVQADWANNAAAAVVQYTQDAKLWTNTIYTPYPANFIELRGKILKRLFTVYRLGSLQYRTDTQSPWRYWDKPIAAALSHGGRVLIRIKKRVQPGKHSFWNWLVTGNASPTDEPTITAHLQSRTSSTHSIEFAATGPREIGGGVTGKLVGMGGPLVNRDFGMNLAVGGITGIGADGKPVEAMGAHGHLFLYYNQAPASDAEWDCALLVGCETVAPDGFQGANRLQGHLGTHHARVGGAQSRSVTGGKKWRDIGDDASGIPGEFDCMKIDIETSTLFTNIIVAEQSLNAATLETWLGAPTLPPRP